MVFQTVNSSGVQSQIIVHPSLAAKDGTSATVVVPTTATTGYLRVVGDQNASQTLLQIVPVVTSITVVSVPSDGTSAEVTLSGSGFIEGNGSAYQFGTTQVLDGSISSGPDCTGCVPGYNNGYQYAYNGSVTLTVPLSAASFGPISVTTAGGTSGIISSSLSGIVSTALSGTAANAALASANPGQAVTLKGTGLSTTSGLFLTYTTSDGTVQTVLVHPSSASADGTSATLILPGYVNGVAKLSWLGASSAQTLQIVPVVTGYSDEGSTLTLSGSGFVEGASSYQLPGATVKDTAASSGPDVVSSYNPAIGYLDNTGVNIPNRCTAWGLLR